MKRTPLFHTFSLLSGIRGSRWIQVRKGIFSGIVIRPDSNPINLILVLIRWFYLLIQNGGSKGHKRMETDGLSIMASLSSRMFDVPNKIWGKQRFYIESTNRSAGITVNIHDFCSETMIVIHDLADLGMRNPCGFSGKWDLEASPTDNVIFLVVNVTGRAPAWTINSLLVRFFVPNGLW